MQVKKKIVLLYELHSSLNHPLCLFLEVLLLENAKRQRENGQKKDGRSEPSKLFDHVIIIFLCPRVEYVEKRSFSYIFSFLCSLSFVHLFYLVQEEAESVCGNM